MLRLWAASPHAGLENLDRLDDLQSVDNPIVPADAVFEVLISRQVPGSRLSGQVNTLASVSGKPVTQPSDVHYDDAKFGRRNWTLVFLDLFLNQAPVEPGVPISSPPPVSGGGRGW